MQSLVEWYDVTHGSDDAMIVHMPASLCRWIRDQLVTKDHGPGTMQGLRPATWGQKQKVAYATFRYAWHDVTHGTHRARVHNASEKHNDCLRT